MTATLARVQAAALLCALWQREAQGVSNAFQCKHDCLDAVGVGKYSTPKCSTTHQHTGPLPVTYICVGRESDNVQTPFLLEASSGHCMNVQSVVVRCSATLTHKNKHMVSRQKGLGMGKLLTRHITPCDGRLLGSHICARWFTNVARMKPFWL